MKTQHCNITILTFVLNETSEHQEQDLSKTLYLQNQETWQSQSNSYNEVSFSLVQVDHSRRNILHNFLQLWHSCAAFICIRGTSCTVNADHVVVPKITFYLPVWEQFCSCSIPFPDLNRTCKTASKDPELQQWIWHLAKYCTSKEINLECYSWNVSKIWVSSSHTHVSHLEALAGDGRF